MKHDRHAVVAAVQASPNLGVAAERLGASRRTLQNRMREYELPEGQPGRRKRELAFNAVEGGVLGFGALLLAAGAVGLWWLNRQDEAAKRERRDRELRALDIISRR